MTCTNCDAPLDEAAKACGNCGQPVRHDLRGRFSDEEWLTLELVPLWVAYGMAFADGRMDPAEAATICEQIGHPENYDDPLAQLVLSAIAANTVVVVARYQADARPLEEGLREAASIVDAKCPPEEARGFKICMMALADFVARASGGIFGIGDHWSREERDMAAVIMGALGLQFDPSTRAFV